MTIELDEVQFSPEMVKRITRPRALKILNMIIEAREVIINTHPEPTILRQTIHSPWFANLVAENPDAMDPNGTIRFLQKLDDLFAELGSNDDEPAQTGDGF